MIGAQIGGCRMDTAARPLPDHVPPELVFDYEGSLDPTTDDDPFARARALAQKCPPIFYSRYRHASAGGVGSWVCSRYEDIREVFQNTERYSSEANFPFFVLAGEPDLRAIPLSFDPPEHNKYRALLNPHFSPKAVNVLETRINTVITELIDSFIDKGECDISYDFGRIYPVKVFMALMGFPDEKFEDFLTWGYAMLHEMHNIERVAWGARNAIQYLRGFIEEVRANPANHLTSHIVHGKVDGQPITEEEIIGTMFFLWIGGLDTVAATSALSFRQLALDQELQKNLRDNPDLHADAIEEFLRMNPTVNTARMAKVDHELGGLQIKKGERLTCFIAAGNYDAGEFESATEFIADRAPNRHLTFVAGPHRCLGSHLARRELRIALTEVLRRIPQFRLKPGSDRTVVPGLMAVQRLPIVWDKG
jgi:cytochrome P450